MSTFAELGIKPEILQALSDQGFTDPTPIQAEIIPLLLNRPADVIGLAQTGTGKTAAFGIPVMQLADPKRRLPQSLILCPTRELCVQVTRDLMALARHLPQLAVTAVYGGAPIEPQIRALRQSSQVVVATPGRLNDHLRRHSVDLSTIRRVVLDEADEMLNMGFKEELNAILAATPADKNTLLFSATMSREVANIAADYMREPVEITVGRKNVGAENVRHLYYMVHAKDRYPALKRIADLNPDIYAIIFCRTRQETKDIADKLIADGYNADALHGDLSQGQRDQVMNKFRSRSLQMLVATDVAARGLDVNDLTHVINYNLPDDAASYTHRSGRTGRAGKTGTSVAIINLREMFRIRAIESRLKRKFEPARVPTGREICERQLMNLLDTVNRVRVDRARIEPFLPAAYEKLAELDREELIKRFVSLEFNRFLEYYENAPDLNVAGSRGREERQRTGKNPRTGDRSRSRQQETRRETPERPARHKPQPEAGKGKPATPFAGSKPAAAPRKPLELADFLGEDDDQPSYRKSPARPGEAYSPARFDRQRTHDSDRFARFRLNVGKKDGIHAGGLIGEINSSNGGLHIKVGRIEIGDSTSVIEADRRFSEQVLETFANLRLNGKQVAIEAAGEAPSRPGPKTPTPRGGLPFQGKAARGRKGVAGSRRTPGFDRARRKSYKKPWGK